MIRQVFNLFRWIRTSFANLGDAMRGTLYESEEIRKIRQEMEERATMSDRERLHLDKENYTQDHRRAYQKLTPHYG